MLSLSSTQPPATAAIALERVVGARVVGARVVGARVVDETVVAYLLAGIVNNMSNLSDGRVEDMVSFSEVSSSHII